MTTSSTACTETHHVLNARFSEGELKFPPARTAWSIWALGAALYLTGFFQRVAPGVMTQELMAEFQIAAAGLGHLSGFYFYAYVAMQIPTGLMVDRFGARAVLSWGALVATLGGLVFALAPDLFFANAGRALVGGAVGVAWVCTLKLAAHWLAPRRFALASGLALAAGMAGAVCAGVPLRWGVNTYGWRPVMLVCAAVMAVIAVLIVWIVRDDPSARGYRSYFVAASNTPSDTTSFWQSLRAVFAYRNTWFIYLAPQGLTGAAISFGGLWGVPYLVSVYGYTPAHAAFCCSVLLLSWGIGGPLFGGLSDRLRRRKQPFLLCVISALVLWSSLIYSPVQLPGWLLLTLLVSIGLVSGSMVITFAYAKESVPAPLAGTVGGVANMGSMTGAMLQQPLVGWILDRSWHGATQGQVRVYDAAAYQAGFTLFVVWIAISLLAIACTRETQAKAFG